MRTIIGISGASGGSLAVAFLKRCPGEKYLIASRWGRATLFQETGLSLDDLSPYVTRIFSNEDMNAPFASGSVSFDQYIIMPCSVTTLGRIANGLGDNLISRVGEVALKEGRRMILGLRESPLSAVALENSLKLARLGVTIMPLSPPFYFKDKNTNEMIDHFVDHLLKMLNMPSTPGWRETILPESVLES